MKFYCINFFKKKKKKKKSAGSQQQGWTASLPARIPCFFPALNPDRCNYTWALALRLTKQNTHHRVHSKPITNLTRSLQAMQVVSQARRLSRALKSPILLNSDRFLAPDFRFLESPLTSLQCPNHHSFSSLTPCFSGTSTFVYLFFFCLVSEKVVVKRKHRNDFEIVENKEQKKKA